MAEKYPPSIVFMGTPEFAAIVLAHLAKAHADIRAVYTQPDKAAGRKLAPQPSAVKKLAMELNLPIRQPANFRDQGTVEELQEFGPDFLIVAAYGLLLPQVVLNIPHIAPINLHGSLLPKYRGAAPIQRAVMENWGPDAITGVSIMKIILALDAGPVYATCSLPIGRHTWGSMALALAEAGSDLLVNVLPAIAGGELQPTPQDNALATYAPKLVKADGIVKWNGPLLAVDAQIRGVTPWPGARTILKIGEKRYPLTILKGSLGEVSHHPAGTVKIHKKGVSIACSDRWYEIEELKPEGRKTMTASSFVNGLPAIDTTGWAITEEGDA